MYNVNASLVPRAFPSLSMLHAKLQESMNLRWKGAIWVAHILLMISTCNTSTIGQKNSDQISFQAF